MPVPESARSLLEQQRHERRSLRERQHQERRQLVLSLKDRQREERERLILQAAEELFLERGFYETSIDDIAARVGVAKGTVYLHFVKKDELVLALFDRNLTLFFSTLDDILSSPSPPRDKLRTVMERVYSGMLGQHFHLLHSVMQNPEFRDRLESGRQSQHDRWHALAQRIGAVMEEGKAAGDFDPAMPTPVMVSVFISFITPIHYPLIVREHMTAEDVVQYLSRCLFRAIGAPHSGEENA